MDFYQHCAEVLCQLRKEENTSSLRSLCYSSVSSIPQHQQKRVYKVVSETLKYTDAIDAIVKKSQILKTEKFPPLPKGSTSFEGKDILHVLVYQLLFSQQEKVEISNLKGLKEGNKWLTLLSRNLTRLKSELSREKIRRGVTSSASLRSDDTTCNGAVDGKDGIRFVRINLLLSSTSDASTSSLPLTPSPHVPSVYTVPTSFALTSHQAYKSGQVIIQDLGSCMPAHALFPSPPVEEMEVLDCCAAPGNKTSHLAAILGNKGKVHAFERDEKRFQVLKSMCGKAGAKNIQFYNRDFLSVDPTEFKNVTHILCDPSCSGSGMVTQHAGTSISSLPRDPKRLSSLSNFQLQILSHALRFPSAMRVTYSTCSVWGEENEEVVWRALQKEDIRRRGWTLAKRETVIPTWERRGDPEVLSKIGAGVEEEEAKEFCKGMVRCDPFVDECNAGFFLACFERKVVEDEAVDAGVREKKRKRLEEDDGGGDEVDEEKLDGTGERKKKKKKKGKTKSNGISHP
ncbi:S-adenosyl-L-methionine-dependent methyltransferase [Atractiella rhizophila]|nr:S-adenosyl-L-methionine-dependent methyltransferase [Atractiella rhizophila]